jgi:hypothetical protein
MAGFNAADAVDPFEYNFAPYADAKGTIPEPSDGQVNAFYAGLGAALKEGLGEDRVRDVDLTDRAALAKLQAELTVDDMNKVSDAYLNLYAAVCSNEPSRDDLEALPYRLRAVFYGSIQGWLSPEALRPATNA